MDAAGLDGLARRRAGHRARRAFSGGVAGTLAAAVVGNAASGKHTRQ